MKSVILMFIASALIFSSPDEANNFKIENNRLIWQSTYTSNLSKEDLLEAIRNSGYFINTSIVGNKIYTELNEITPSQGAEQFPVERLPSLFVSHHIKSYVIIDLKEDRYRVTLKSIKFIPRFYTSDFSHQMVFGEEVALNREREGFRERFVRRLSPILDQTFLSISDFNK